MQIDSHVFVYDFVSTLPGPFHVLDCTEASVTFVSLPNKIRVQVSVLAPDALETMRFEPDGLTLFVHDPSVLQYFQRRKRERALAELAVFKVPSDLVRWIRRFLENK